MDNTIKKGDTFTVFGLTLSMKQLGTFVEGVEYQCHDVIEFTGIGTEIWKDEDNWINLSFCKKIIK